jgi:excisionase family DNA binding protein
MEGVNVHTYGANVIEARMLLPVERKYLRPSDVIAMTGLATGTVYEALARGDLKSFRVGKEGRALLIPVEEVDRWIRKEEGGNDTARRE